LRGDGLGGRGPPKIGPWVKRARGGFPPPSSYALTGDGLRPAAATRGGAPGHPACTVVAQIGRACSSASVREGHAHCRATTLADLLIAAVANEYGLTCHGSSLNFRCGR